MLTQDDFTNALEAEIQKAGLQTALAEKLGMTQSQISDYLRGRFQIENMTIGNLFKLFPATRINLQGENTEEPVAKSLEEQLRSVYRHLSPDQSQVPRHCDCPLPGNGQAGKSLKFCPGSGQPVS